MFDKREVKVLYTAKFVPGRYVEESYERAGSIYSNQGGRGTFSFDTMNMNRLSVFTEDKDGQEEREKAEAKQRQRLEEKSYTQQAVVKEVTEAFESSSDVIHPLDVSYKGRI